MTLAEAFVTGAGFTLGVLAVCFGGALLLALLVGAGRK